MIKKLLFQLCIFACLAGYAQQNRNNVSSVSKGKDFLTLSTSEARRANTLINENQDAVYYSASEGVKTYGAAPAVVHVSASDFPGFSHAVIEPAKRAGIEAVVIRINTSGELQQALNLANLQGFQNLRYVYVLCTVDASPETLLQNITNPGANLRVIYDIEKGS